MDSGGRGRYVSCEPGRPGGTNGRQRDGPVGQTAGGSSDMDIKKAPVGLAVFALVGPSFVWAAEYIGSGEVVIATRTGAILGTAVLWAVVFGIFLKFWIGMSGARYTVCTGEGMIDMFDRIGGPRHWVVWLVLVVQTVSGILSIGALAAAAGAFAHSLVPQVSPRVFGWLAAMFAVSVVWKGAFNILKMVMSFFVLIIVIGALYIAAHVFPSFAEFLAGFACRMPAVPEWAKAIEGVSPSSWDEILPVLGWGAGGFASQVWYSYWVLGAGYGAAAGRGYGRAADGVRLSKMSRPTAERIKGWCRVLYVDSSLAMVVGIVVTGAFLISGAGILGVERLAPNNDDMADTLSKVFSMRWNVVGGFIFKLSGAIAMVSTLVGQLAGWPRMLADSCRICIPGFDKRFPWKTQFRMFLVFFFCASMLVVFVLGLRPMFLVKLSAILEGVLLTALQAICVAVGLYVVMPKMLSKEAYDVLRPSPIFAAGLIVTFLAFGYICVVHIPPALVQLLGGR
ncbi:MAG: Nramp family divalent metal transporter [Phycisphaerales bacterium]|nr:MAG: Nramp family divalent metal transporter [Phycisphaerales bacterium]